ncbi:colanic acid biosynthesis glycosyltransferase WcaL [Methyloprofundus sedimenti]|uniref:Colanic acid biosynthesis glycosyltransferase WcaL n=1 Tax=Methyloprofundus sedimenti TaxID=1420851 RepID=A0A1V8M676_9GAMM|nr:glycosyltransferase [Methyloprofundus sedimenti]OQK17042.1 colanic acid biosynthesis glycosyltransferase WcaL [Methyloprofundus sedimenti]
MKVAYFTNQYPKVSHSFIRREILALEQLGYEIERFALRSDAAELVDRLDQDEFTKTAYILSEPKVALIFSGLTVFLRQPVKFIKTLLLVVKMGFRSDRGVLKHIAYLLEACVLLKWQKQKQIQHIHAHFGTNSTAVVMFAYLLGGAGYSFTVHGPEEFDKPEFIALSEKIKHSRFVVAISSFGRSQLFRWIPAEQWPKVKIVRCGLGADFLGVNEERVPNTSHQLICVGRLCEQKGQLLLLESMRTLKQEGIECQLVLAGDGPMRPEVERRITEYELQDRVKITGWISSEQVKSLLIESRGLVLPSFAEGLPVVIMEALALSRPVISTYIAGIPELVINGKNGWLVSAGDSDALTKAMRDLLSTEEAMLLSMGRGGYEAVNTQHNIDTEAAILARHFAEALSE